jgi:hypothetical protein
MSVAQPGTRVQELDDRLIVRFRPFGSSSEVGLIALCLVFWTLGGIAAVIWLQAAALAPPPSWISWDEVRLLVVCVWVFGACAVSLKIARQIVGRDLLTVRADHLEVRRELGRFVRVKRFNVERIRDIRAARVPTGEEPRTDFCLQVVYDEKAIRIGEGMGEREAQDVASAVLSWIRLPVRGGG